MTPLQSVWEALMKLPRPVDYDTALQAGMAKANEVGANQMQFKEWFETEYRTLLPMLNGQ